MDWVDGLDQRSAERRRQDLINEWLTAAERDKDVELVRQVARDACKATQHVRQADESERGWSYYPEPDHNIRLLGAKLLADVDGLTGAASKVQIAVQDNSVHLSVDQRLMELEKINVDRKTLLADMAAILRVEREAPLIEIGAKK